MFAAFALWTLCCVPAGGAPIRALIVADEMPAMEVLADQMKSLEQVESRLVTQAKMPASLKPYDAVLVYIHGRLDETAERQLLAYAEEGGKLVLLHHSISSGKRRNREWFAKLGVELPEAAFEAGGYKWIEGVTLEVANLAPRHFITSHGVQYPDRFDYPDQRGLWTERPGIRFDRSEVYLNHRLLGARIVLLGLKYADAGGDRIWIQHTAGWLKRLGKGLLIYLMPGHTVDEFRSPAYARIIANAVIWKEQGIKPPATRRRRDSR